MYETEEFLWGGLRNRLERNGRLRPRTVGSEDGVQRPAPVRREARISPVRPAMGTRMQTVGSAQGR
jgi:hypothetical protein